MDLYLWQAEWDGCVSNKLHSVKPVLGYSNLSRQDAVMLFAILIVYVALRNLYCSVPMCHQQTTHSLTQNARITFHRTSLSHCSVS